MVSNLNNIFLIEFFNYKYGNAMYNQYKHKNHKVKNKNLLPSQSYSPRGDYI